jgi:O-antigen ligase
MPASARADRTDTALLCAVLALCAALPLSIACINIAAAALTVLLLWSDFSGKPVPWDRALTAFSAALAGYFVAAAIVSAAGVDPSVSFRQLNKDFHKLWLLWLMLTALPLAGSRRLPAALGAGATAAALVGLGQSLFMRSPSGKMLRASGFVHPVSFGELMGLIWLGAFCFWLRPGDAEKDGLGRKALSAFLLVCGAAALMSQTRGAAAGVAAGVLALGLCDARLRRLALKVLLAAPAVLIAWELLPTGRKLSHLLSGAANHTARLTFWRVGWDIFKDHPWVGVGPGNYRTVFGRYFSGEFDGERIWGSAHNLYVHQAAERGLLGLAALAAVLGTMTWRAWRRARRAPDAPNLWAFAACCAFLVMNMTEVAFQNEQVTSLMLLIWAYAEARPQPEEPA